MRRPPEERWDKGVLGLVGGVPWRVDDDDDSKADGEAMKMDIPPEARQAAELEKEVMAQAPIPRNFYITNEHLTQYGYSQDCPGCKSLLRETTRQAHNTACRRRFEREGAHGPKVRRAIQSRTNSSPSRCRGIISYTSYSRTNDYVILWLRHCVQLYAQQHHA